MRRFGLILIAAIAAPVSAVGQPPVGSTAQASTSKVVLAQNSQPLLQRQVAGAQSASPGSKISLNPQPLPPKSATLAKVPFGNVPCKSLTQEEQQSLEQKALGYARPTPGKPDRAPATLPFDNVCFYSSYVNVGYMTQADYETNSTANRSASQTAPGDLPRAFYDNQAGLWFATNGYYVTVKGSKKLREEAARVIAAKLLHGDATTSSGGTLKLNGAPGEPTTASGGTLLGGGSGTQATSSAGRMVGGTSGSPSPNTAMLRTSPGTVLTSAAGSCQVRDLMLKFHTGNDDLRGGQNNLNVEIHFANGSMQTAANVNHGANWPNNSVNSVDIPLKQPVAPNQIKTIILIHLAQGGYTPPSAGQVGVASTPVAGPMAAPIYAAEGVHTEDNWDMADFQAFAQGLNRLSIPIASTGMHRFTGSDPSLTVNTRADVSCAEPANAVRELEFIFKTGNDDLRGGNDNVGVTINFTDGSTQFAPNLNQGQRWPDESTHEASVLLNRVVALSQIKSITLFTTFQGGSGGDNWNMDSVEIRADGQPVTTYAFHRFSADWSGPKAKYLTIAIK
jgi:hypothetical protein